MTRVCPWWFCPAFDNPIRRLFQDPERILEDLIKSGDTILDLGCGMGYFSIPMARLAGVSGNVICVDLQDKMLAVVEHRARQAGLSGRVRLHRALPGRISLTLTEPADFTLVFWMLHEVRDEKAFLAEIWELLKPGAHLLISEPKIHVRLASFRKSVVAAQSVGFHVADYPAIAFSRSVLMRKGGVPYDTVD
jgi:2-polyprenyl-3-methyl-5-hydroxy-6-metoxy-1,4-benzoquinol methylase